MTYQRKIRRDLDKNFRDISPKFTKNRFEEDDYLPGTRNYSKKYNFDTFVEDDYLPKIKNFQKPVKNYKFDTAQNHEDFSDLQIVPKTLPKSPKSFNFLGLKDYKIPEDYQVIASFGGLQINVIEVVVGIFTFLKLNSGWIKDDSLAIILVLSAIVIYFLLRKT